uniref:Receptor-like serine/threonine-protein kinase n=1 Tax=Quercus lobata TaxID=97700 RepID=A0A7N2LJH9_QUELO
MLADSSCSSMDICTICGDVFAGDSLNPGDTLNSSTYMVSAKGKFALGFFQRIESATQNSYLAISEIADQSRDFNLFVWFGSGVNPIVNNSSMLILDNKGTLKVVHQGGDPILLFSPPQPNENTVATLLDSGNFILKVHLNGSMKQVLWQSFDYLADTLLPGMKLGVNYKTGQTWSLTSWLTEHIPVPGAFTLEWDYGTPRDLNWSLSNEGWFIGKDNVPVAIARADKCDGYNIDGGCQRWNQPVCRHHGDTLVLDRGHFVSEYDSSYYISDANLGFSDCEATCWGNCSCVAFNNLFENSTGCKFWTNISDFVANNWPYSEFVYILSTIKHSHSGKEKWIWIGTGITFAFVILASIVCYLLRKRKAVLQGNKETDEETELLNLVSTDRSIYVNEVPNDRKKRPDVSIFSYECVVAATNNFSLESKLGEGGFGSVYMGTLLTGQKVAVKWLSRNSGQGITEFKNELILISKLQHTNLVKLLGCCILKEERMLIYEYMPNKSLDYFLFDSSRSKLLDWKKRFNIIEGIAQGLIYLHKYSRLKVIHRDLKASNILLDESMNPKISDFGMARIFNQNKLEANTTRIVGTYGYMSPEYAMEGLFSIKSDVYSFGVLMLEIVSGRRNINFHRADHVLNLVGYAWDLWKEGEGLELIDPTIGDSCNEYQVLRCIHVSLLCVENDAIDRPTISNMLAMLTNDSTQLPLPKKPAFSIGRKTTVANISKKEPEVYTVNGLSISDMDAR